MQRILIDKEKSILSLFIEAGAGDSTRVRTRASEVFKILETTDVNWLEMNISGPKDQQ